MRPDLKASRVVDNRKVRVKTEEFRVDVEAGQLYVKRWTPASCSIVAPVVLLHDSLGCTELWRQFPEALAAVLSRPVIAYDRLGFGQSDARHALPSFDFIAQEATEYFPAVKEFLSLQRYVVLGHSVGGSMAINIAADPDCQAAITVSSQAFVEDLTLRGILDAKEMFAQPGQMERLQRWHGEKASWVFRAWTDIWLDPEYRGWSLQPALERVDCPVLALHGDNDEFGSNAFPEFIADKVGDGQMLILENCGHVPHREKPEQLIAVVQEFLAGVS